MASQHYSAVMAVLLLLAGPAAAQAQQHAVVNGQHVQPRADALPQSGDVTDPAAGVAVDPKTNSYVPLGQISSRRWQR